MRTKPYRISVFKPDLPNICDVANGYADIHQSGIVSNFGPKTQQFENIAKEYLGNENVMAVSSCDTGLTLAIKALGLPAGARVAASSFTFTSTINAITWNNLTPVFIDIDRNNFNMSMNDLEQVMQDFGVHLIVPTHIFGNPCDMYSLSNLSFDYKVPVIFDAAHAYGSSYRGVKIGAEFDLITDQQFAHVYSFSGTKLVTCGEGGLISTTPEMAERIKYLRAYGFHGDYNAKFTGLNGKISEFNAMIGTYTLPTIDEAIKRRNQIAWKYKSLLGDSVGYQFVDQKDISSYKDFAVIFKTKEGRDRVYFELENNDIQTKKYFMPLHHTDKYKSSVKLPETEFVYDHILCLPIYNSITDNEIEEVASILKSVIVA